MKLCKTLTELCKNKGELQETYTNKAPDFCSFTSLKEAFHFTEEIFHFWKKFFFWFVAKLPCRNTFRGVFQMMGCILRHIPYVT